LASSCRGPTVESAACLFRAQPEGQRRSNALDLADPQSLKRAKAERAADKAREKFGDAAVMTGRGARIEKARKRD